MKSKTVFECTECGAEYPRWMGRCSNCGAWNSLEEKTVLEHESKAAKQLLSSSSVDLISLGDIKVDNASRIATKMMELDGVLSGGLIDRQVILISGEPGVGKSTLLLQMLVNLNKQGMKCIYVSGEESASQVAARAQRLFALKDYQDMKFLGGGSIQALLGNLDKENPQVVVVDSIQTVFDEGVSGLPGSLTQVKAATSALVRAAKSEGFILIIVGHINKAGTIAGPKALEHLVDTVLTFEGDSDNDYRMLRAVKNRFGNTGEVGLFLMGEGGLLDAGSTYGFFTENEEGSIGAARTLVLEGNRPLLVEVQALTNPTVFAYPKRVSEGLSMSRLQLVCAILDRFADSKLGNKDVYLRTAGNYPLKQVAGDMSVAAAILSSVKGRTLDNSSLFLGEMNLSGKFHLAPLVLSKMQSHITKLGVKTVYAPTTFKEIKGVKQVKVASAADLLRYLS